MMNPSTPLTTRTQRVPSKARTVLFLVLGIETILFGTLVISYLQIRGGEVIWQANITLANRLVLSSLNTGVLLLSGWVAHLALVSVQQNRNKALITNLQITLLLGLLFVAGQVAEFRHLNMTAAGPGFGGIFLALIGFHALHVLAGIVLLALNLMRAYLGDFNSAHSDNVEVGTLFWYYVTAVWAVLFTLLFLI